MQVNSQGLPVILNLELKLSRCFKNWVKYTHCSVLYILIVRIIV